jgi:hypothetical protein
VSVLVGLNWRGKAADFWFGRQLSGERIQWTGKVN